MKYFLLAQEATLDRHNRPSISLNSCRSQSGIEKKPLKLLFYWENVHSPLINLSLLQLPHCGHHALQACSIFLMLPQINHACSAALFSSNGNDCSQFSHSPKTTSKWFRWELFKMDLWEFGREISMILPSLFTEKSRLARFCLSSNKYFCNITSY